MSHRSKTLSPLLLILPVALALVALVALDPLGWRSGIGATVAHAEAPGARALLAAEELPSTETGAADHSARNAVPVAALLSEQDIRDLLEQIGALPWDQLEEPLRPLILRLENMELVLSLLRSGELHSTPDEASLAEIGAVKALAMAALAYNVPGDSGELHELGLDIDGRAFLVSVIEALAVIPAPSDATLAHLLGSLRIGDRALLGVEFLEQLRTLAVAYPEKSELFESLIAGLAAQLSEEEGAAYYARFLTELDSPKLLKDALIGLFADESQQMAALAWATELFDDHPGNSELQREIAMAIAAAAPEDEAAAFFGERATSSMYAQLMTLGTRPEGGDAILAEYDYLATLGSNPESRKMLVSGMASLDSSHLTAVALHDSAPEVRGQAGVTLTAFSENNTTPETLELIRTGYRERHHADLGIPPYQALSSAHNIARKTRDSGGPVLDGSVSLMREIALEPTTPTYLRERAVEQLSSFLSHDDWNVLQQQVSSLPHTPPN
ncbi:MAG TPA: hypothetical protein QF730_01860 [Planctomycetota bacterium]|jgi:hypothetical protein|nr:hypothetical protein [Planctomycetota bacterium]